jgi:hypothetical protein
VHPAVVVAPDREAAAHVAVLGASPRERSAALAALALVGADARRLRVRVATRTGTRTLVVDAPDRAGTRASRLTESFLATLVATDAADRLGGRRVAISPARLERTARVVRARAARAGWKLAPPRLYTTSGGAVVVTVQLDDRTLLGGEDTGFESTLLGTSPGLPVRHALLLIEGPDGVLVGGGADDANWVYGGVLERARSSSIASFPGWLILGPTDLQVTIFRSMRWGRPPTFTLSCGIVATVVPTAPATCSKMLRERSVLFSPIQNDTRCPGGPGDDVQIEGVVAGIPVARIYGNCYLGVARAWEDLLQA